MLGTEKRVISTLGGGGAGYPRRVVCHIEWQQCWARKTGDFSHVVVAVLGTENGCFPHGVCHGPKHRKRVIFHKGWSNGW